MSVDSCPVNCIYWVDTEELAVLEHLSQPQEKHGHGIYAQGWERPANVFMAAKSFNKQLKQQKEEMGHGTALVWCKYVYINNIFILLLLTHTAWQQNQLMLKKPQLKHKLEQMQI